MIGFKYYSWTVSMEDGSRFSYDFQIEEDAPWTDVLKKFGSFLNSEGYSNAKDAIDIICYELDEEMENRIEGIQALNDYHSHLEDDSKVN
jgi:hypothetical protein